MTRLVGFRVNAICLKVNLTVFYRGPLLIIRFERRTSILALLHPGLVVWMKVYWSDVWKTPPNHPTIEFGIWIRWGVIYRSSCISSAQFLLIQ
ncbi:hypothetical protein Hanom_Chr15g01349761 [Helianthus anomalus]